MGDVKSGLPGVIHLRQWSTTALRHFQLFHENQGIILVGKLSAGGCMAVIIQSMVVESLWHCPSAEDTAGFTC